METIVYVLLILLIFLISCDSKTLINLKDRVNSLIPLCGSGNKSGGSPLVVISDTSTTSSAVPQFNPEKTLSPDNVPVTVSAPDTASAPKPETFINTSYNFNSWELPSADYEKLDMLQIENGNYGDLIKNNVDSAIIESHKEYVADSDFLATTGASHASTRDDFNPPVGWHGLPRKAHYAQIGSDDTARVQQSETSEDIINYRNHNSTDYCL